MPGLVVGVTLTVCIFLMTRPSLSPFRAQANTAETFAWNFVPYDPRLSAMPGFRELLIIQTSDLDPILEP